MPNFKRSCTNLKINAGHQYNEKNGGFTTFSKKCYSGVSTTYYSSRLNNNNSFYAKKHETICMSEKSRKLSTSATLSLRRRTGESGSIFTGASTYYVRTRD